MDRNSFSYVWLVMASLGSFIHLSWMLFSGKFTFTYIGMIFTILYGLQTFSEYKPTPMELLEFYDEREFSDLGRHENTSNRYNQTEQEKNDTPTTGTYVQYRQFSPSQHHHLSSHRMQVDSKQPECVANQNANTPSTEFAILQFCVYLLSTSFFTTDLFFAYQVFAPDLNYIPLIGGLLNIIPALYIDNAQCTHLLFIFTIPPNCWGQVYYGGFNQNNIYAMLAGYFFFVAYYYNDVQRIFKGLTPQSQANYYMGSYCVFASLALQSAFTKFNFKSIK